MLWWFGPTWLRDFDVSNLDSNEVFSTDIDIRKPKSYTLLDIQNVELISRFSNLNKIIRIMAYVLRVLHSRKERPYLSYITANEYNRSLLTLCKMEQRVTFSKEYAKLRNGDGVSNRSKILSLNPFIDEMGLIRLDGRLSQANVAFEANHQIILLSSSRLSKLLVRKYHEENLHANLRLLCSMVRERFWIVRLKNLAKFVIKNCVICQKQRKIVRSQMMGSLPPFRIEQNLPFVYVGIDFCGPFQIMSKTGRGRKTVLKSYCCVFVCLTTKAAHLELVSDLTTSNFIATLTRFMSRRGKPSHIYTDNGGTFVGTNNKLQELYSFLSMNQGEIAKPSAQENIEWHFIPPYTPHMGGMWEACVRSLKYHLNRILGTTTFTFEELSTILTRIEACLNSRPLCPLSENPEDFQVLTPGHFLVGRPLTSITVTTEKYENLLPSKRWFLVQKVVNDFWFVWKEDYLSKLVARTKWKKCLKNLKVKDLVTFKEKNKSISVVLGLHNKNFSG